MSVCPEYFENGVPKMLPSHTTLLRSSPGSCFRSISDGYALQASKTFDFNATRYKNLEKYHFKSNWFWSVRSRYLGINIHLNNGLTYFTTGFTTKNAERFHSFKRLITVVSFQTVHTLRARKACKDMFKRVDASKCTQRVWQAGEVFHHSRRPLNKHART